METRDIFKILGGIIAVDGVLSFLYFLPKNDKNKLILQSGRLLRTGIGLVLVFA